MDLIGIIREHVGKEVGVQMSGNSEVYYGEVRPGLSDDFVTLHRGGNSYLYLATRDIVGVYLQVEE